MFRKPIEPTMTPTRFVGVDNIMDVDLANCMLIDSTTLSGRRHGKRATTATTMRHIELVKWYFATFKSLPRPKYTTGDKFQLPRGMTSAKLSICIDKSPFTITKWVNGRVIPRPSMFAMVELIEIFKEKNGFYPAFD